MGKTQFRIMANTAHKPTPAKLKVPTLIIMPPIPVVNTELTITRFFGCIKSTFASINVLMPKEAIVPNSSNIIPPITGMGIEAKNALNLPKNAMQIAKIAAQVMMTGLLFLVIITAPVTSP